MGLFSMPTYTNIGYVVQGYRQGYYIYNGSCVGESDNSFALIPASYIKVNMHGVIWYEDWNTGVDSKDYLEFLTPQNVASYEEISAYQSGPKGSAMLSGTLIAGAAYGLAKAMNSVEYGNDIAIYLKTGGQCIVHLTDPSSAQRMKTAFFASKNAATQARLSQERVEQPKMVSQKNPYEEIKQLKSLLDIGAITQEEFDKKKKKLLNLGD